MTTKEEWIQDQALRCRSLWADVVRFTVREAWYQERRKRGTGARRIRTWAESPDGEMVLGMAGIAVSASVVDSLEDMVRDPRDRFEGRQPDKRRPDGIFDIDIQDR